MQLGEGQVNRQSGDTQVGGKRARRRKPRGIPAKAARYELVPDLPIQLLMQRFRRGAIEPNHFESDDGTAAALFVRRAI
jgi:hypothetical protein